MGEVPNSHGGAAEPAKLYIYIFLILITQTQLCVCVSSAQHQEPHALLAIKEAEPTKTTPILHLDNGYFLTFNDICF